MTDDMTQMKENLPVLLDNLKIKMGSCITARHVNPSKFRDDIVEGSLVFLSGEDMARENSSTSSKLPSRRVLFQVDKVNLHSNTMTLEVSLAEKPSVSFGETKNLLGYDEGLHLLELKYDKRQLLSPEERKTFLYKMAIVINGLFFFNHMLEDESQEDKSS